LLISKGDRLKLQARPQVTGKGEDLTADDTDGTDQKFLIGELWLLIEKQLQNQCLRRYHAAEGGHHGGQDCAPRLFKL
jgi:hypothetical protein